MSDLPSPLLPDEETSVLPEVQTSPKNHKRTLLRGGVAVVAITAVAGLGYATWTGYLPNPFLKCPTPEQFLAALTSITSAETTIVTHAAIQPLQPGVTPLDFSLFGSESDNQKMLVLAQFSHLLPSDLDLNLAVTSSFTKTQNDHTNEETHIAGTYSGNNITAKIDITTRTVDGVTYIKPDAIPLPLPLFDLQTLKGKWIDITSQSEHHSVFTYVSSFETDTVEDTPEEQTDPQAELLALLQQAIADEAIIFSVPERITYEKDRAWHVEAVVDGGKLRETVLALGEKRKELFPDITQYTIFTDSFLEASAKERAKDIYRELFSHVTLSALLNNDASPLVLRFSTQLAPKSTNELFQNRQLSIDTEIGFTSINTPQALTAPENALTSDETAALLTGTDPQDALSKYQQANVEDLQTALALYKWNHEAYPASLDALLGIEDKTRKVTYIPTDIFTENAYDYTPTDDGYTLRYEMPEGETQGNTLFSYDATVTGTNTATELFFSEEGAKISDRDEDGISTYDEVKTYKTSDDASDTDGDGYTDKAEIDSGHNPNGI